MKIIIIGAYGNGLNLAENITHSAVHYGSKDEVIGFAIDNKELGDNIGGYPVLCKPAEVFTKYGRYGDVKVFFCLHKVGQMRERIELLQSYGIPDDMFHTFVHPSSYVSESMTIGKGSAVLSGCSINSKVTIGKHAIISTDSFIGHDTSIGDCSYIASRACVGGYIRVRGGVFIGLNSTIRERVAIGDFAIVGMAAVVLSNVNEGETVFGNPARAKR